MCTFESLHPRRCCSCFASARTAPPTPTSGSPSAPSSAAEGSTERTRSRIFFALSNSRVRRSDPSGSDRTSVMRPFSDRTSSRLPPPRSNITHEGTSSARMAPTNEYSASWRSDRTLNENPVFSDTSPSRAPRLEASRTALVATATTYSICSNCTTLRNILSASTARSAYFGLMAPSCRPSPRRTSMDSWW